MNKLTSTLGKTKKSKVQQSNMDNYSMMKSFKSKTNNSIWLLDGQNQDDQKVDNDVNIKFLAIVKSVVEKKFLNEKYLDETQIEDVFDEIINELCSYLQDVPTELAKLSKIQSALVQMSDSYLGQTKNHLKNFQSLLDVRIRKLKRKQKKADLSQFDKIVHQKQLMKKKHQVMYIDQDCDEKKHIQRKENRIKNIKVFEAQSKKSYGTMNSGGSNENQSGSGRKSGGSQSRSSEGNALAVLLSNRDPKRKEDDKNQKTEKSVINQSYDFSAIMSSSVAVRQRNTGKPHQKHDDFNQTVHLADSKIKKKDSATDQKDEAFIFHRPKKAKKLHF